MEGIHRRLMNLVLGAWWYTKSYSLETLFQKQNLV